MFETSVLVSGQRMSRGRRLVILPLSIALHAAVIVAALGLATWTVDLPAQTPAQIQAYVIDIPLAPSPPPTKGGGPQNEAAPPRSEEAPKPDPNLAPNVVPAEPIDARNPGDDAVRADVPGGPGAPDGDPNGDINGIPGGVAWGVPSSEPRSSALEPIHVTADVRAPRILYRVEPEYPELARRIRAHGVVEVRCIIDRSGTLRDIRVSSSPNPLLAESTVNAIRKWRFSPGTLRGKPVDVYFTLKVRFDLR